MSQLYDSIDKLFHYIFNYVKQPTEVVVRKAGYKEICYERTFVPPSVINISPTLYTRIDGCHGAGNCCRVPFDLIYTPYCYHRVKSASIDHGNRSPLLATLCQYDVTIGYHHTSKGGQLQHRWIDTHIWIKENVEEFSLSGTNSCPFLEIGDDRYWCGIHEFKPLHCWYPHMTVRRDKDDGSVNIGRMQYGRNHNFGCPVVFMEATSDNAQTLFPDIMSVDYFKKQFDSDCYKLNWTSKAAESLGFTEEDNFAVGLDGVLVNKAHVIKGLLRTGASESIELWRKPCNVESF